MNIKKKNIEILTIAAVMEGMTGKKLPYLLGRAVSRNLARLKEEKELINEERISICKECAQKDESGNPVIKDNEYLVEDKELCNKKLNELFETEVEIDVDMVTTEIIEKCDMEEFDTLTVEEAGVIDFMAG